MSLEGWVTFCTIHAKVEFFFFLHGNLLCCSASFRLLMSVAMLQQPALIVFRWQVHPSTHQRGFSLSFSLSTSRVLPRKTAVNGSSCNPSSGNVYFFLFKISFRYLNKCCCSSFTLVILTLWFSIFFFFFLSPKGCVFNSLVDGWKYGLEPVLKFKVVCGHLFMLT